MRLYDIWQWKWDWKWKIDNLDKTLIALRLDIETNIFVAKHSQTIRRQFADELFECVWPFCGIGA